MALVVVVVVVVVVGIVLVVMVVIVVAMIVVVVVVVVVAAVANERRTKCPPWALSLTSIAWHFTTVLCSTLANAQLQPPPPPSLEEATRAERLLRRVRRQNRVCGTGVPYAGRAYLAHTRSAR